MFRNRIQQYLDAPTEARRSRTSASNGARPRVPRGFAPVPEALATPGSPDNPSAPEQLYRLAYEAAQAQAQEKLLALLRSRCH